jgi:hypothetical protein
LHAYPPAGLHSNLSTALGNLANTYLYDRNKKQLKALMAQKTQTFMQFVNIYYHCNTEFCNYLEIKSTIK